ncbi:hypothetical protein AS29_004110 [Bacillus sp. SJS]|nr:hypothetical protein AS29_004110 [Bacillus sp. SJS]
MRRELGAVGKPENWCDARQECQANRKKGAMPGKNARQTRKTGCYARQECQGNRKKGAMPGKNARETGKRV